MDPKLMNLLGFPPKMIFDHGTHRAIRSANLLADGYQSIYVATDLVQNVFAQNSYGELGIVERIPILENKFHSHTHTVIYEPKNLNFLPLSRTTVFETRITLLDEHFEPLEFTDGDNKLWLELQIKKPYLPM